MKTWKSEAGVRFFKMSEAEYSQSSEMNGGLCTACGQERGGCEPDARNYPCEGCGARKVFGLQELLIMGRLDVVGSRVNRERTARQYEAHRSGTDTHGSPCAPLPPDRETWLVVFGAPDAPARDPLAYRRNAPEHRRILREARKAGFNPTLKELRALPKFR